MESLSWLRPGLFDKGIDIIRKVCKAAFSVFADPTYLLAGVAPAEGINVVSTRIEGAQY
jgi:hypothetical protein